MTSTWAPLRLAWALTHLQFLCAQAADDAFVWELHTPRSAPKGHGNPEECSSEVLNGHGRCFLALEGVVVDEGRNLGALSYGVGPSECAEACGARPECHSFSECDAQQKCWMKDKVVSVRDDLQDPIGCRTYYEVACEAEKACSITAGEACAELRVGIELRQGQLLTSQNGQFRAVVEARRLAIYFSPSDAATVIWELQTPREISHVLVDARQPYPQVVGTDDSTLASAQLWASHGRVASQGLASRLALSNNGELQLLSSEGLLWSSASRAAATAAREAAALERAELLRAEAVAACARELSCASCARAGCGWCVAARRCVPDERHFCEGPVDHVGAQGSATCTPVEAPRPRGGREGGPEASSVEEELRRRAANAREESGAARPYEVLDVQRDAAPSAIRRAYRRLSLRLHPDKHPKELEEDATLAFADLVAAYSVIGNPDKRNEYDNFEGSADDFEKRWESRGSRADEDFYFGHPLISTLTDRLWTRRVTAGHGQSIWLVELYAAWCSACRNMMPKFVQAAERLASDEIDVGAVNCAKNSEICFVHVPVKTIPAIVMIHPAQGMQQWYTHPTGSTASASADDVVTWARQVAREWRWLFANSELHDMRPVDWDEGGSVQNSTDMWVVLFTDGQDCKPCKSAKTNLMRLSSSVLGLPVACGVLDCAVHRSFCHELHQLPPSPFRPVVKLWPRGTKTATLGHSVYSSDALEPHVALMVLDAAIRAALAPELDMAAASALSSGAPSDFRDEPDEPDKSQSKEAASGRRPVPPDLLWEGPSGLSGALPGPRSSGQRRTSRLPELG